MAAALHLFSVPIFFIILRETIEGAVIVSVLLAAIDKMVVRAGASAEAGRMKRLVWIGTFSGLFTSFGVGAVFLVVWYRYALNLWQHAEHLWEGVFGVIASLMVTVTAIAMLKANRMYEKYQHKLAADVNLQQSRQSMGNNDSSASLVNSSQTSPDAIRTDSSSIDSEASAANPPEPWKASEASPDDQITNKKKLTALFWLPFVTMLREGLESVVFMGGVAISEPSSSIPLAAVSGCLVGCFIGFVIHRGGSKIALRWFFIVAACVLLLIANGLLVKSIGNFEDYVWGLTINAEADDAGTGLFDPRRSVWHFDCCNPEDPANGGWAIFNSLLGWRNNATISTITVYCLFWVLILAILATLRFKENRKANKRA